MPSEAPGSEIEPRASAGKVARTKKRDRKIAKRGAESDTAVREHDEERATKGKEEADVSRRTRLGMEIEAEVGGNEDGEALVTKQATEIKQPDEADMERDDDEEGLVMAVTVGSVRYQPVD